LSFNSKEGGSAGGGGIFFSLILTLTDNWLKYN
jgi:hypothetical protein